MNCSLFIKNLLYIANNEFLFFSFNGDHLGFNDTPEDFEFEGGEAIDLRVKKK